MCAGHHCEILNLLYYMRARFKNPTESILLASYFLFLHNGYYHSVLLIPPRAIYGKIVPRHGVQ